MSIAYGESDAPLTFDLVSPVNESPGPYAFSFASRRMLVPSSL